VTSKKQTRPSNKEERSDSLLYRQLDRIHLFFPLLCWEYSIYSLRIDLCSSTVSLSPEIDVSHAHTCTVLYCTVHTRAMLVKHSIVGNTTSSTDSTTNKTAMKNDDDDDAVVEKKKNPVAGEGEEEEEQGDEDTSSTAAVANGPPDVSREGGRGRGAEEQEEEDDADSTKAVSAVDRSTDKNDKEEKTTQDNKGRVLCFEDAREEENDVDTKADETYYDPAAEEEPDVQERSKDESMMTTTTTTTNVATTDTTDVVVATAPTAEEKRKQQEERNVDEEIGMDAMFREIQLHVHPQAEHARLLAKRVVASLVAIAATVQKSIASASHRAAESVQQTEVVKTINDEEYGIAAMFKEWGEQLPKTEAAAAMDSGLERVLQTGYAVEETAKATAHGLKTRAQVLAGELSHALALAQEDDDDINCSAKKKSLSDEDVSLAAFFREIRQSSARAFDRRHTSPSVVLA